MDELRELLLTILWLIVAIVVVRGISRIISGWRAKRRIAALAALDREVVVLCKEASQLSPVRFTTELIPQHFPSKEAAQLFGDTWSMGGSDSFKAKAIDSENRDEDHPNFNSAKVSGGILYSYPALFFGMKNAHGEGDEWFLSFARARNAWMKKYLFSLKNET